MTLEEYYQKYGSRVTQESEKLFIDEFLFPLLGEKIDAFEPQYPFLDSTGRMRRIDFAYVRGSKRIALEVNGETYHAEGIIPNEMFDDNLFRQNEILRAGYDLLRFSYSQLKSPQWRPLVHASLRAMLGREAPELLSRYSLDPNTLQIRALEAINFYRDVRGWSKGVVILPTGTGKTILSALDAKSFGERVLFLVHRLDILKQTIEAYRFAWPDMKEGILTGEVKENEMDAQVLFASKDTMRQPEQLARFPKDWFGYIVIDEVHHGQSPTYQEVISYFQPKFMLGMTATPDRTDRKDIFELFDYRKILEVSLQEAIEQGFLVPYTYYGLTDNVDYSRIRFQNNHYRVDDLERLLIVPERNEAVVKEYLDKGGGDKAIGFCVSINHAERMAEVFTENGIVAAAVHSKSPNRDEVIKRFRNNEIQVVFTVDLFNEGVDFPNVRVLLFLRPTESKTVFLQQLGRGLRLSAGKERVRILDFIGNYKRANQIRKYLSTGQETSGTGRQKKVEYVYSTGCEVIFDAQVEEILNQQDTQELEITKEDLTEAYYAIAESLEKKPSRADIDSHGDYKSLHYARVFGSWSGFLREIGEYTEASYHYPQGTHLGHILSILYYFGKNKRQESPFKDEFIRLRGGLDSDRLGAYQRQVKYKLQAAMELGILTDDRKYANDEYELELTPLGRNLFNALEPTLETLDLSFPLGTDGIPSTRMKDSETEYNNVLRRAILESDETKEAVYSVFLSMHAVQQMLAFIYQICREPVISRQIIYEQFFKAPFVREYLDQEGIEEATEEASRRRCPFLLNILNACGIVQLERSSIKIEKFLLAPFLVRSNSREDEAVTMKRLSQIVEAWPDKEDVLDAENLSIVKELFGADFLTDSYYLKDLLVLGAEYGE